MHHAPPGQGGRRLHHTASRSEHCCWSAGLAAVLRAGCRGGVQGGLQGGLQGAAADPKLLVQTVSCWGGARRRPRVGWGGCTSSARCPAGAPRLTLSAADLASGVQQYTPVHSQWSVAGSQGTKPCQLLGGSDSCPCSAALSSRSASACACAHAWSQPRARSTNAAITTPRSSAWPRRPRIPLRRALRHWPRLDASPGRQLLRHHSSCHTTRVVAGFRSLSAYCGKLRRAGGTERGGVAPRKLTEVTIPDCGYRETRRGRRPELALTQMARQRWGSRARPAAGACPQQWGLPTAGARP